MANTPLDEQIAVYESMREDLERDHMGKWVVVHGGVVAGYFETHWDAAEAAEAAEAAVQRFGDGPYLIREIGAPDALQIPAAVQFGLARGR